VLQQFLKHISNNSLFSNEHKLVLAVSGGVDSVVLGHLLHQGGFNFELAHCNFNLRGKDSNADEKFCVELAKKLNVKIYIEKFDVKNYCKVNKVSTQMAARELRYNWFEKLLKEKKIDYLLTAHHANDTVETVLINMLRGTGIKGLTGIPEKSGKTIRPLLIFRREEIDTYSKHNKLKFRVDKSNLDDKYDRNFLRLNIVPKLKKLHPNLENTITENTKIFKQEADIINDFLTQKQSELVVKKNNLVYIDKQKIKNEKHISTILHFILYPFGYKASQVEDIKINCMENGLVGKNFKSKTHQLTIDRNSLIIKENYETNSTEIKINSIAELNNYFKLRELKKIKIPQQNQLIIEPTQFIFPLTIRAKKTGDTFKPFGMNGFKLVSDFLKDQKLNTFEKENVRLLINGNNQIIWIIGYRSDERYKVKPLSAKFLKLTEFDR